MQPYEPPSYKKEAFNCLHCNAYANQIWRDMLHGVRGDSAYFQNLEASFCAHCKQYTLWRFEKVLFPQESGVPLPNPDLSDEIKADYLEARAVLNTSPRAAGALLRLCIQKLCCELGEKGKDLNHDIANLVKKGLPPKIQQALDVVRVTGNNAVHPGQIDLRDDQETAGQLFGMVNLIAEVMITQPNHVATLYESLPESARKAIEKRDTPS